MGIEKTAKGVLALESKTGMGPRERQLMVLCNGKRNEQDLVLIFGESATGLLQKLESTGFLQGLSGGGALAELPARARSRSLAACKVYLIDLLLLQQSDGAGHIVLSLRSANEAQPMMEMMLVALGFILEHSGERYTQRVASRIFETIPDENLGDFITMSAATRLAVLELLAQQYQGHIPA